jgi:acyl carrier protein
VTNDIKRSVQNFLLVNFNCSDTSGIHETLDLFEAGIVDSYGLVDLVSYIENRYGICLDDEELASPELGSVAGIAALIKRKIPP